MKKIIFTTTLTVLLLLCLCFSISAASATANVNSVTATPGSTVEFKVSLSGTVTVRSGAVSLTYDSTVLQFLSGECTLTNASVANFDNAKEKGAFLYTSATSVQGTIFTVKFKVLDSAKLGASSVKMELQLKDASNNDITVTNNSGTLKVCKFTQKKTDAKYLKSAATCTSPAVYYYSCEHCGEKGTTTFTSGNALNHQWSTILSHDATHHWYKCTRTGCTAVNQKTAHSGGTASCTEQAVCSACKQGYGSLEAHEFTVPQHDVANHWNKCKDCSAIDTKHPHDFGDDTVCDTCQYELTGSVTPTVKVTIENNGTTTTVTANKDSAVTVIATSTADRPFLGWKINGQTVSTELTYTFTVAQDITIVASFQEPTIPSTSQTSGTTTPPPATSNGGYGMMIGIVAIVLILVLGVSSILLLKKKRKTDSI